MSTLLSEIESLSQFQSKDWAHDIRQNALQQLKKSGLPNSKLEAWKYIPTEAFFALHLDKWKKISNVVAIPPFIPKPYIVFENGVYSSELSQLPESGVTVTRFEEAKKTDNPLFKKWLNRQTEPQDITDLLSVSLLKDGVIVEVANTYASEKPLHILYISNGKSPISAPNMVLHVPAKQHISIAQHCLFQGEGSQWSHGSTHIVLEDQAQCELLSNLADHSPEKVHLSYTISLENESDFKWTALIGSPQLYRIDAQLDFNGVAAKSAIQGLNMLGGSQKGFIRTRVRHHKPECESTQRFKTILKDEALSEFNGLVYVHPEAQKTDSSQKNENLVLSDKARALSRPQLEIFADDVKCGHGATVGQLNEQEIFYLMSRGLNREESESLILQGFAKEILSTIKNPTLKRYCDTLIETFLSAEKK